MIRKALLNKYDNSLLKLLQNIYPNENWAERAPNYEKEDIISEPQMAFLKKTKLLFPYS